MRENQLLGRAGMAVAVAHLRFAQDMPVTLAVERHGPRRPRSLVPAIGAGVLRECPADRTGNAVIEVEAADTMVESHGGDVLVRADCARLDAVFTGEFETAEALRRKPDDDPRNTAVRTSRLEPSATTITGTSSGTSFRRRTRSSVSCGWNMSSARPPARNQVTRSIGASGVRRPPDAATPLPSESRSF